MFFLDEKKLFDQLLELIRVTSTTLPNDIMQALLAAVEVEDDGSPAKSVLIKLIENVELATQNSTPVCQDTGTNIYYVNYPCGVSTERVRDVINCATVTATKKLYLRPNSVNSITGVNSGDNTGVDAPQVHFEEWDEPYIKIKLMLKGGGSENVSTQYTLPDSIISAGRNLTGVYKCVIDAVNKAQGLGCAPGIIAVGIGGDRASGMKLAKKQLFRKLDDINNDPQLAELETKLLNDINSLGIGPMGFGGKTTALSVKIGALHRLPASFFVSIAYMCWACRKGEIDFQLKQEEL